MTQSIITHHNTWSLREKMASCSAPWGLMLIPSNGPICLSFAAFWVGKAVPNSLISPRQPSLPPWWSLQFSISMLQYQLQLLTHQTLIKLQLRPHQLWKGLLRPSPIFSSPCFLAKYVFFTDLATCSLLVVFPRLGSAPHSQLHIATLNHASNCNAIAHESKIGSLIILFRILWVSFASSK